MDQKVWYVLQSMILLEDGVSQFELMTKYSFPAKYITLAKKVLDNVLTIE